MRRYRDLAIVGVLFVLLVVFTVLGPAQSKGDTSFGMSPTTHSSSPKGALALFQWAERLGYDARRLEYTDFAIEDDTAALIIADPSVSINNTQSEMILSWVGRGGVLLLAQSQPWFLDVRNRILDDLKITIQEYNEEADTVDTIEWGVAAQPLFTNPPIERVYVKTRYVIHSERDNVVPLIVATREEAVGHSSSSQQSTGASADDTSPTTETTTDKTDTTDSATILAGIKWGEGYIYVSSAVYPFTNEGLRHQSNSGLVMNVLQRIPPGERILFDEYHHGYFSPPSFRTMVWESPWGQALIYALTLIAVYLLLTGRRFGRPVPLAEDVARRSSTEYVESMADLFQRSGKRAFLLKHYHRRFKRVLAKTYGISPQMEDEPFIAELARTAHLSEAQKAYVRTTLNQLRKRQPSETDLLRTVSETLDLQSHANQRHS